jgi:hypothetical protein
MVGWRQRKVNREGENYLSEPPGRRHLSWFRAKFLGGPLALVDFNADGNLDVLVVLSGQRTAGQW